MLSTAPGAKGDGGGTLVPNPGQAQQRLLHREQRGGFVLPAARRAHRPRHAKPNPLTLGRRNNGYFIVSSVEAVSFQPRDVPTGPPSR